MMIPAQVEPLPETPMNAPIRPLAIQAADALLSNRRSFCIGAGALLGSTLLGGLAACGGSDDDHGDPIWGASGAATLIVESLTSLSQASFAARDFSVTDYGASQCTVIAAVNPYTDA